MVSTARVCMVSTARVCMVRAQTRVALLEQQAVERKADGGGHSGAVGGGAAVEVEEQVRVPLLCMWTPWLRVCCECVARFLYACLKPHRAFALSTPMR
eukprot:8945473-Pyramimonas_sp.AAC.1